MALGLRRLLKKNYLLLYSGIRSHYSKAIDQRNAGFTFPLAMEVKEENFSPEVAVEHSRSLKANHYCCPVFSNNRIQEFLESEIIRLENDIYWEKIYIKSVSKKNLLHCGHECRAYNEEKSQKDTSGSSLNRPDVDQLENVLKILCNDLPNIIIRPLNYNIYHKNLIFENNIRGTRTIGIANYFKQITLLRYYMMLLYAQTNVELLKVTSHVEDGTVRVRWRVKGLRGMLSVLMLEQNAKKNTSSDAWRWYDGFSIFYVKGDGLVHKHVASKMMPDETGSVSDIKNPLAALMVSVMGNELYDDISLKTKDSLLQ